MGSRASTPTAINRAVRDGLGAVAKTGERFYEAELHRLDGEALAATGGNTLVASTALRRAVEVASQQGAGLFALRSAIRLATMASDVDQGRDLLAVTRGNLPPESQLPEALLADSLLAIARS